MKVLFSCIGKSDPFGDDAEMPGPILTLLEELVFDRVYLLHDTKLNRKAGETARQIGLRASNRPEIEHRPMLLDDPSNYPVVLRAIRHECEQILLKLGPDRAEICVQISSGTPQMQWAWVVLIHRGIIPARAIALHPRYLEQYSRPYHHIVDLSDLGIGDSARLQEALNAASRELQALKLDNESVLSSSERLASSADEDDLPESFCLLDYLKSEKRRLIAAALRKHPDNASEAARMLGLEAHTFRRAAEDLGLRPRRRR